MNDKQHQHLRSRSNPDASRLCDNERKIFLCSEKLGSALCLATLRGDNDEVEALLKSGAPPDYQEAPDGWTPLIYSIYYDNPAGRRLLLSYGADPMISDYFGKTTLMFAAINGDVHLLTELLTKGLPPFAADCNGKTALDFAMAYHNHECAALLKIIKGAEFDFPPEMLPVKDDGK